MTIAARVPVESEKSFQARLIQLARLMGWEVYHTYDSRRSAAGWPDLELVRPPRYIRAELKREGGHVEPEQLRVLDLLRRCPGVETYVWTPADWNRILRTLGRHD